MTCAWEGVLGMLELRTWRSTSCLLRSTLASDCVGRLAETNNASRPHAVHVPLSLLMWVAWDVPTAPALTEPHRKCWKVTASAEEIIDSLEETPTLSVPSKNWLREPWINRSCTRLTALLFAIQNDSNLGEGHSAHQSFDDDECSPSFALFPHLGSIYL